jgi:hypothetical protein
MINDRGQINCGLCLNNRNPSTYFMMEKNVFFSEAVHFYSHQEYGNTF